MTHVPDSMIPAHGVVVGDRQPDTANGKEGSHDDVRITIEYADGETDSFSAQVDVQPSQYGDLVRLIDAPKRASVEMLGYIVTLRAAPIADGEYIWQDNFPRSDRDTQDISLSQITPCAICESDITDEAEQSAVGWICRLCDYKLSQKAGDGR